jgi:hypothetical protein
MMEHCLLASGSPACLLQPPAPLFFIALPSERGGQGQDERVRAGRAVRRFAIQIRLGWFCGS